MAKLHRNKPTARMANRPGEGLSIDVHLQQAVQADGQTTSVLGIDLASAPVPDRRYVSDVVSVIQGKDIIKILFGQEKISSGLRSLVVIHMASSSAKAFVAAIFEMKNPVVNEMQNISNKNTGLLFDISEEPEQTVALAASVAAAAISGQEACIDFYQISSFARVNVLTSKKINIDPVVRVELPTSLLVALVVKLKEMTRNSPLEE